jgi:hypothetical protein
MMQRNNLDTLRLNIEVAEEMIPLLRDDIKNNPKLVREIRLKRKQIKQLKENAKGQLDQEIPSSDKLGKKILNEFLRFEPEITPDMLTYRSAISWRETEFLPGFSESSEWAEVAEALESLPIIRAQLKADKLKLRELESKQSTGNPFRNRRKF